MKIVGLATVTDGMLTTDVTEPTAAWNSGTAYVVGNTASKNKRIWEAIQNGTNKDPETEPDYWLDAGPTNPWAMFDTQISTQSTRADSLSVSIDTTERFDTLALFNINAASVNVTVLEGATERYNEDHSMVDYEGISDYWDHFFNPVRRKTELLVEDLPLTPTGMTLEVTATATGETAAIGHMAYGQAQVLGGTQFGASFGYLNFSKFEDDGFGGRKIIKGIYKKQGDFDVWLENSDVDWVHKTLIAYKDTPALIIASDLYSSALYFGLIVSAKITLPGPKQSALRVQIEDF